MRVLVDARPIYHYPTLRGVGWTLLSLYRALAERHPDWTFTMAHQVARYTTPPPVPPHIVVRRVDGRGDRFGAWQNVWLPAFGITSRSDVVHCHGAIGPRFPLIPLLTTIHDLTPLEFRKDHPHAQRWGESVARSARVARRVLTPSEHVRREVHRVLDIPLDKITAVHWGRRPEYDCGVDVSDVLRARERNDFHADRPYVLHFGMSMTRKNTAGLMRAWSALPQATRALASLEIVGLEGASLEEFKALAESLGISASCGCHGYVDAEDVQPLTTGAAAVAYVSLSEGFGLPLLDAFACGTPVIASNNTCLPEIAGGAARLVDPSDCGSIRDALDEVLTSPALREELSAKGRLRVLDFSWNRCADAVSELLIECTR